MSLWRETLPPINDLLSTLPVLRARNCLKVSVLFFIRQCFVLCFIFLWLKKIYGPKHLTLFTLNLRGNFVSIPSQSGLGPELPNKLSSWTKVLLSTHVSFHLAGWGPALGRQKIRSPSPVMSGSQLPPGLLFRAMPAHHSARWSFLSTSKLHMNTLILHCHSGKCSPKKERKVTARFVLSYLGLLGALCLLSWL